MNAILDFARFLSSGCFVGDLGFILGGFAVMVCVWGFFFGGGVYEGGGICPGVLSGGVLSGVVLSRGVLSVGGVCPVGFVRGVFVQGVLIVRGVLSGEGVCPGGFVRGVLSGGFCPGGWGVVLESIYNSLIHPHLYGLNLWGFK